MKIIVHYYTAEPHDAREDDVYMVTLIDYKNWAAQDLRTVYITAEQTQGCKKAREHESKEGECLDQHDLRSSQVEGK